MKTFSTFLITLIIVIIVYAVISYFIFKKLYKTQNKISLAFENTFLNNKACPDAYLKNIKTCPFKDQELSIPPKDYTLPIISSYLANLIGKLEYNYKMPLEIISNIYYEDNLFGVILTSDNFIFIVFRGTKTVAEWMKDFAYDQISAFNQTSAFSRTSAFSQNPAFNQTSAFSQNPVKQVNLSAVMDVPTFYQGAQVLVHGGFLHIYNTMKQQISDVIKKVSVGKTIIVTGHSLGAAIAILTALDLKIRGSSVSAVVFASPRIGNIPFTELVSNLGFLDQWINTEDIVPTLPYTVSPNFNNPASPYIFSKADKMHFFSINRESLGNNHVIPTYIEFINTLSE